MLFDGTPAPVMYVSSTQDPAIFTADGSGSGRAAALNQDQSDNSRANPAARGSTVVLFLTGEGQTAPPGRTPQPLLPVAVLIDGQPASVTFYGEAPVLISGVMQRRGFRRASRQARYRSRFPLGIAASVTVSVRE